MFKSSKRYLILALFSIFVIALYVQIILYPNGDAIWLLHCAKSLLHGKTYYHDFFETNPPLILFFYMPAVGLAKLIGIKKLLALQIYMFVWIAVVLWASYFLLKRMFPKQLGFVCYFIAIISGFLTILPFYAFSEREHCAILFILPYLFLMTLRLENKPVGRYEAIVFGLLAGVGFSFKPYFLIPLVLIEGYYLFKKRSLSAYLRPEPICILSFMIFYLGLSIIYFPEYFHKVLPLTLALYTTAYGKYPLRILIMKPMALTIIVSLFLIGWQILSDRKSRPVFLVILFLSSLGFFVVYLLAAQYWYYHIFPALLTILIALVFIIYRNFHRNFSLKKLNAISWLELIKGFIAVLLVCQLVLTSLFLNAVYLFAKNKPSETNYALMHYMRANAGENYLLIFSAITTQSILRYYTQARYTSRFPGALLIPGLKKLEIEGDAKEHDRFKRLFFQIMMQDIKKRTPTYIIISKDGFGLSLKSVLHAANFQYIPFLLSDKQFRLFFSYYKKVATTDYFLIYKRKPSFIDGFKKLPYPPTSRGT